MIVGYKGLILVKVRILLYYYSFMVFVSRAFVCINAGIIHYFGLFTRKMLSNF